MYITNFSIAYFDAINQGATLPDTQSVKALSKAWFKKGATFIVVLCLLLPLFLMVMIPILSLLTVFIIGLPLLLALVPTTFYIVYYAYCTYLLDDFTLLQGYKNAWKKLKENYISPVAATLALLTLMYLVTAILNLIPSLLLGNEFQNILHDTNEVNHNMVFSVGGILWILSLVASSLQNILMALFQGILYYSAKQNS